MMRKQLLKLAWTDTVKQYRGSAFGWAWAVIQPAFTIFVYWFGFSIGLRQNKPVDGYPRFLWLVAGMVPWFYMKAVIKDGAGSIRKYSYLVKRIKYPVDTIPTFVSISDLQVNLMLQLIVILIFWGAGYPPTKYLLQIPLFAIMAFLFFTAWSLFAGMLSVMSTDFLNLVKTIIPGLFWFSGILYDVHTIKGHEMLKQILLFNPVTIIVNGYRNSLVHHKWFWETPVEMRNYCLLVVIMSILSIWAYNKLKKEIPDVL
ncbi:MAG: ABC transporter permease [Eubacterium sp.]|nr:ABC transporter permease [Eubacterium sp.]